MGSVTRNMSMDDLVGGLFRIGGAAGTFPRTDSEAAFQEFLKRIPSSSNLAATAAVGHLDSAGYGVHGGGLGGATANGGGLPASASGLVPLDAAAMMPRVPSLDFLRHLANTQQMAHPPGAPLAAASNGLVMQLGERASGPELAALGSLPGPALSAVTPTGLSMVALPSVVPLGAVLGGGAASAAGAVGTASAAAAVSASRAAAAPAPAGPPQPASSRPRGQRQTAAAARATHTQHEQAAQQQQQQLQQQQQQQQSQATSEDSGSEADLAHLDPKDPRRAKRMLSNRESARRSRKRKQEHLSVLEVQIADLARERAQWQERLATISRTYTAAEDETRRLRDENTRLKDELNFLRSEVGCSEGKDKQG